MNIPKIIQLPKIADPRGNLTFLQSPDQVPFEIKRVFWTYDIPGGEQRGGHAYYKQHELIIALSGSFDVVITNRNGKKDVFSLNRSYYGLFVPAKTWRHMENFSTNSLGLHLSSMQFKPSDYIRDYEIYKNMNNE
ncbi:MAG: FdtA/QdtA family cupin domain-containing protein [Ginsengibacter sp.]